MSAYTDYVLNCKKKLEKGLNDEKAVSILHRLKRIPMSIEILQQTGIGKLVRNMKNNRGEVGEIAKKMYDSWRKAVVDSSYKTKVEKYADTESDKVKSKSRPVENHKDIHNEKKVSSNYLAETTYKHQSKTDIKYKNKMNHSHKSSSEYNQYDCHPSLINDSDNVDSESENEVTFGNCSVQKKIENNNKGRASSTSHKGKVESPRKQGSCVTSYQKSNKQLKESNKRELSSDTKSSKQESRTKTKKSKLLNCNKESFNSSNASFEDILGLNDTVSTKKRKILHNSQLPVKISQDAPKCESSKKSLSSSKKRVNISVRTEEEDDEGEDDGASLEYPEALKKPRLAPLDPVDILATLPPIQPNYKPLPHKDVDSILKKKKTTMSNEEAIMFTTPRRDRTAVYAGRRNIDGTQCVRSLYDQCTRVLIENVEGLSYTGGVPYHILKPVLQTCNPVQLYTLESYNPELCEDTDELWKVHCEREFKRYNPLEHETWRELYLRKFDEREAKLKEVTASISANVSKTSTVRKTKLAYVDSVAKPPRDVARRQAKHGTGLPCATPQKAAPPTARSTPRPTAPTINALASSSAVQSAPPVAPKKQRVAPLMQKTLKYMKQHYRR